MNFLEKYSLILDLNWQAIREKHEGWDLHHEAEVEFGKNLSTEEEGGQTSSASKAITLEITAPSEEESQMWDFFPVTLLKVEISSNEMA